MQQVRIQITGPGSGGNGGPGIIARILLSIGAVILLVSAAFLGAIFVLAALGFFIVGMLALAVRIWWARRQLEKAFARGERPGSDRPGGSGRADVIEGEYLVVEERREAQDAEREPDGGR
jgi:predicted lipid-binding transport protein (Tim44 family)